MATEERQRREEAQYNIAVEKAKQKELAAEERAKGEEGPQVYFRKGKPIGAFERVLTPSEQMRLYGKAEKEEEKAEKEEVKAEKREVKEKEGAKKKYFEKVEAVEGAVEGAFEAPVSLFRSIFRITRGQKLGRVRKPVHPDRLIDKKSLPLYLSGGAAGKLIGGNVTPGSKEFYGLGNSRTALKDAEVVLQAINRGATDVDSICLETGLREMDVAAAVKALRKEGYDIDFLKEA